MRISFPPLRWQLPREQHGNHSIKLCSLKLRLGRQGFAATLTSKHNSTTHQQRRKRTPHDVPSNTKDSAEAPARGAIMEKDRKPDLQFLNVQHALLGSGPIVRNFLALDCLHLQQQTKRCLYGTARSRKQCCTLRIASNSFSVSCVLSSANDIWPARQAIQQMINHFLAWWPQIQLEI